MIAQAKALYEQKRAQTSENHPTFDSVVRYHLTNGIVRTTKTSFVLAKPVVLNGGRYDGRRAWYVTNALGSLRDLARVALPVELPFIAFTRGDRRDRFKVYETNKFRRKIEVLA